MYKQVDYIFFGTKQLQKRCRDFFDSIQLQIRDHRLWKGRTHLRCLRITCVFNENVYPDESEERVISSRDCLETYVMTRLHTIAFASVARKNDDEALYKRLKALSFITPRVRLFV